jgi:hypothetical protein
MRIFIETGFPKGIGHDGDGLRRNSTGAVPYNFVNHMARNTGGFPITLGGGYPAHIKKGCEFL